MNKNVMDLALEVKGLTNEVMDSVRKEISVDALFGMDTNEFELAKNCFNLVNALVELEVERSKRIVAIEKTLDCIMNKLNKISN